MTTLTESRGPGSWGVREAQRGGPRNPLREPRGNKVLLQRLQAVCNKFFRLIFNLGRTDSVRGLLKSNDILDIYQNYDFDIYKHMHKAIYGESPKPVQKMLGPSNDFFFF